MLIVNLLLSALELETLRIRREKLCLSFAKKCLKSQKHSALFPVEPVTHNHQLRNVELFTVNYARTEKYRKSAIPYMQRKLNFLWYNLILICEYIKIISSRLRISIILWSWFNSNKSLTYLLKFPA